MRIVYKKICFRNSDILFLFSHDHYCSISCTMSLLILQFVTLFLHFALVSRSSPIDQESYAPHLQRRQFNGSSVKSFAKGTQQRQGQVLDDKGSNACDGVYGVRKDGDLPFNRATRGNLMFFGKGEQNTPDGVSDKWL